MWADCLRSSGPGQWMNTAHFTGRKPPMLFTVVHNLARKHGNCQTTALQHAHAMSGDDRLRTAGWRCHCLSKLHHTTCACSSTPSAATLRKRCRCWSGSRGRSQTFSKKATMVGSIQAGMGLQVQSCVRAVLCVRAVYAGFRQAMQQHTACSLPPRMH